MAELKIEIEASEAIKQLEVVKRLLSDIRKEVEALNGTNYRVVFTARGSDLIASINRNGYQTKERES